MMTTPFLRLWEVLTPGERRKSLLMLALVVLMALVETAGVLSIMPFLSVLGRPEVIHEQPLLSHIWRLSGAEDTRSFLLMLGVASIALVVLSSAFKTITLHVLNRFVQFLRHSISSRLLGNYLHQPYTFFLERNPSILARNVLSEVDQLAGNAIQPLSQLVAQGAVALAMAMLVFAYDPATATGIVLVLASLYGGIYLLTRKLLSRTGREGLAANGQRYQLCNEALAGIKEVKITQNADSWLDRFRHASREFARHTANSDTLAQSPLYLVEATGYSLLIVIALLLLTRTNDIAHVLPALGLYGFAAYRMLPSAQILYRSFAKIKFSSATLDTIHYDLGLPQETTASSKQPLTLRRDIRLQGIHYAYPSRPDRPVLSDFNLSIPINTSIGIAGPSGAGKSTVMDILLGLLTPQKGCLLVDGMPMEAGNIAAWQRTIGYVPQHIYLADTSVAGNIAFGISRDAIDMQAVERAARAAQIHDFITNELPQGYDTRVGDRGIRLSGGQRQRIGIARALYRDPPILLMDEATSALDNATEDAVNIAIRNLSGQKTILVIAHRQASLEACARITTMPNLLHGQKN